MIVFCIYVEHILYEYMDLNNVLVCDLEVRGER